MVLYFSAVNLLNRCKYFCITYLITSYSLRLTNPICQEHSRNVKDNVLDNYSLKIQLGSPHVVSRLLCSVEFQIGSNFINFYLRLDSILTFQD